MKALNRLIDYFAHNHLLINFIFLATVAGGVYFWTITGKEALPSVDFNFVRVSASYPGASAGDVEYFITRPLEDALKSVEGIYRVRSTSSSGSSSLLVEIQSTAELPIVVNDIETAVRGVSLPSEVRDIPRVRQFKTSQRAILDVALIDTEQHLLDYESRSSLQDHALALENRLNSLMAVNTVSKSGYLKKQLKIEVIPEKLQRYDITISSILNKLNRYDLKQPLGKLEDSNESEVVVADTDYSPEEIKKIVLRGTYLNPEVRLEDVARIYRDFEENLSITKVNGHEAIILNINKTASYGILHAVEEVKAQVDSFQNGNRSIELVYLDDESVEVQNRITLIKNNGIIGFSIIIVLLFLFLDFTSGFWVAMGILFTFPFTVIVAHFLGYTINNVTLAGVIIVMGMIVDDAIVISENIVRKKREGLPRYQAVVEGTSQMLLPVTASVITTCIAFLPMFAMEGRFAQLASPIPAMVIIMLVASLLESVFLLPGHMNYTLPSGLKKWLPFFRSRPLKPQDWFSGVEDIYRKFLLRALRFRYLILLLFSGMLALAGYHLVKNMNFVMFPNEESAVVFLRGEAPSGSTQIQTAGFSQKVEDVFREYPEEVMNFRTDIGRSRRGRQVEENEFTLLVEVVPKERREKSLNQLIQEWEAAFEKMPELEVKVIRHRFGRGSGETPIEIVVLDDNDSSREGVLESLREIMVTDSALRQVEIDKQNVNEGFAVKVKRRFLELTGLEGRNLISTLRTILNGQVIKEIPEDNEKVDLLLAVPELAKTEVAQVLDFPVDLNNGNTVPLSLFVDTVPSPIPTAIYRERYRRVGRIYADVEDFSEPSPGRNTSFNQQSLPGVRSNQNQPGSLSNRLLDADKTEKGSHPDEASLKMPEGFVPQTPLQIAERYEQEVFPAISARYPNAIFYFDGEVKESRESQSSFLIAFIVVLLSMFMILALLFRSLLKPLIVMAIIPFGLVGVMLAFYLQGTGNYGFFALLGFLGLSGVVVNDTIVMLSRFEMKRREFHKENFLAEVAEIAQTRLRAIIMTTVSTVAGLFPTVYGWAGYDSLLAEMMFVMAWGLVFATLITLVLLPSLYCIFIGWQLTHPPKVEEDYST